MAKDMLGRNIFPGDLVIKSTSGRSSSELLFGVVAPSGKSLYCSSCLIPGKRHDFRRVTNTKNVYKINYPTDTELIEKEEIMKHFGMDINQGLQVN